MTALLHRNPTRQGMALLLALLLSGVWLVVAEITITSQLLGWVESRYGDRARGRVEEWRDLMSRNKGLDEREKLRLVNDFFNELPYQSDQETWGKKDYWATPIEALGRNAADCEDYSIGKYFTLRELGVPDEKLHIAYVKAIKANEHHMVLTYYEKPDSVPLVLDNMRKQIVYANRRKDLKPIYSFNAEGLWLAKSRGQGKMVSPSSKFSLWADLQARMVREMKGGT